MSISNKTIWFEGMFLQPQHFQQQEKYIENVVQRKHQLLENNFWGFYQLVLDYSLISVGKIGIQSAKGVFQDGTLFSMPDVDQVPHPFQIPEGMNNTILYLCLPLQANSAEVGSCEATGLFRYQIIHKEISNYMVDDSELTEVKLGSLATRIMSENEDRSGYCSLAIVQINESCPNFIVNFNNDFMPTYLDIHASQALKNYIIEFHNLLNHRAEMLANRLSDTKQAGTAEIIDFLLLQLFNRYELILSYLNTKQALHPEKLFYILTQLLGELATYTAQRRRPQSVPSYNHQNVANSFNPIVTELRQALIKVLQRNAVTIPLHDQGHGLWVGQLPGKQILKTCQLILAVFADLPMDMIKSNFSSQVKIAPVEQIQMLVSRALPGLEIEILTVAPRQIPYHANFSYFIIHAKGKLWSQLESSAGIAIHVGNMFPGLKLELWAIKGLQQ